MTGGPQDAVTRELVLDGCVVLRPTTAEREAAREAHYRRCKPMRTQRFCVPFQWRGDGCEALSVDDAARWREPADGERDVVVFQKTTWTHGPSPPTISKHADGDQWELCWASRMEAGFSTKVLVEDTCGDQTVVEVPITANYDPSCRE